jgi:hypothetical protein
MTTCADAYVVTFAAPSLQIQARCGRRIANSNAETYYSKKAAS